jgi:hypothetical protein
MKRKTDLSFLGLVVGLVFNVLDLEAVAASNDVIDGLLAQMFDPVFGVFGAE